MSVEDIGVIEVIVPRVGVIEVLGRTGPTGPVGPVGPVGPTGPVGEALRFEQAVPATVWTIPHGLSYDPAGVTVIDSDGYLIDDFGIEYLVSGTSLRLTFDISLAGVAYLS